MKKLIPLTIVILLLPSITFGAYYLNTRVYYPSTGLSYECAKVSISQISGKKTCTSYNPVTKVYTQRVSNLIFQDWSGLYDSQGKKVYEGDTLIIPDQASVVMEYNTTNYNTWLGWVLRDTVNIGSYYPPSNEYGLELLKTSTVK